MLILSSERMFVSSCFTRGSCNEAPTSKISWRIYLKLLHANNFLENAECQSCPDSQPHQTLCFTYVWKEATRPKLDKSRCLSENCVKRLYTSNVAWRTFNASMTSKIDRPKK